MQRFIKLPSIAALACTLAATAAFAHAFLNRAVPGVGTTVQAAPSQLELRFTENIVLAFSGVRIVAAGGAPVAAGKPTIPSGQPNVLQVRLGHPLKPGTYLVTWHVVSVDTHHTLGTYKFTVAP